MEYKRGSLSNEELIHLYESILWPRMIEEKMLVLLRQGKISKWFSGIGQEAIAVGATLAMDPTEWIMPLHRNLGVFTSRKMPLVDLFKQWQGDRSSYSKARERSFHFGSKAHHVCGMISHLGPQLAIADGVALAYQQRGQLKASMAFTGDGGTSEGDFHEALNVAAVWDLPVIFISAKEKTRVFKVIETALEVFESRHRRIPTSKLNEEMLPVIEAYKPPVVRGNSVKIKFVTQLPTAVPSFAFFTNYPDDIKTPYRNYLENKLREKFNFKGVPVRIFFRKK